MVWSILDRRQACRLYPNAAARVIARATVGKPQLALYTRALRWDGRPSAGAIGRPKFFRNESG